MGNEEDIVSKDTSEQEQIKNSDNQMETTNKEEDILSHNDKNHDTIPKERRKSLPTGNSSFSGFKASSLPEDIRKIYKFKEVIGGGHFGTVRIGYRKSDEKNKKYFAIKSIPKKKLTKKDLESLAKEVEILSTLNHPNIIKFYETYHDKYFFHIVMELCTGKDIFNKILTLGKISEQMVCKIIAKVLHAIAYCHSEGISHRDLKPENILFVNDSGDDCEIKLIDFGLSRKYNSNEKMHTILGTPYYIAPEVLKGNYNEKCDIWSIGVLTYTMLCGEPPFNANQSYEIFEKIINDEIEFNKKKFNGVSEDAKDFIKICTFKDPNKRVSASKALSHKWFQNIIKTIHKEEYLDPQILTNLKNFTNPDKFKKLVLNYMVNNISSNELKLLTNAFYAIDLDHSGQIDISDITKAFNMAKIPLKESELRKIINFNNDDEKINYNEFLMTCMDHQTNLSEEKLAQAFRYFDMDNSGYIDVDDIKNALLRTGKKIVDEESINDIIKVINENNEKKISLNRFIQLFEVNDYY